MIIEPLETRRLLNGQAVGWSDVIDNPYMPLIPGTTYDYKGTSGGAAEKDRVIVTSDVKVINGKRYRVGPPELIVEVAYSTAASDRHEKLRDYQEAGVREYVIVALHERRVEWAC